MVKLFLMIQGSSEKGRARRVLHASLCFNKVQEVKSNKGEKGVLTFNPLRSLMEIRRLKIGLARQLEVKV